MIKNFKLRKANLWVDFLDLIGYDYKRITFDYGRDSFYITAWGKVFVNDEYDCHLMTLGESLYNEIYNEIEKMY